MPESIDRLFVEIVANMEPFIETLQEGIDKGITIAETGAKITGDAYSQLIGPIKEMLAEVEEAQRKAFGQVDIRALAGVKENLLGIIDLGVKQGRSVQDVMSNMQAATNGYNKSLGDSNSLMGLVNAVSSKLGFNIGGLASKFGTAAGALGLLTVALKGFIDLVKESIVVALRFQKSQVNLIRQVNKFRAASDDEALTLGVVQEKVEELGKTYGIGELRAEALIATTLKMTRELGLTGEKALQLSEDAAILAASTDDAESSMRALVRFMRTGMSRGLVNLGISIKDTAVQEKAFEHGIYKAVDAIDAETKALLIAEIITEKAAEAAEDAALAAKTFEGRMASARDEVDKSKAAFGDLFTPLQTGIVETGTKIQTFIIDLLTSAGKSAIRFFVTFRSGWRAFGDWLDQQGEKASVQRGTGPRGTVTPADREKWAREGRPEQEEQKSFEQLFLEELTEAALETEKALRLLETGGVDLGEQPTKELTAAEQAMEDFRDSVIEAYPDIVKGMAEITAESILAANTIEKTFQDALQDIDLDFSQRRIDAERDLNRDLADIDEESNESRIQATVDAQVEEFRTVEDHKLALIELEQQYLMDLEDAVRERDARQVLLLQRNFNVEKGQLEVATDVKLKRQREDFQLRLQEIERQRKIQRAERFEEYEEERADLLVEEERKRADAETTRNRALDDLKIANKAREDALYASFINQNTITTLGLQAMLDTMAEFLGPGGYMDGIYAYAAAQAAALNLAPPTMPTWGSPLGQSGQPTTGAFSPYSYRVSGHQRGGSFIATSPELIKVGEGSPERVSVTPLSASTGMPKVGGGAGQSKTTIEIGIDLSAGLEGEIIDQAMGELADVFVKLNQGQRRATR